MLTFALLTGFFSYVYFFLGIFHLLYPTIIVTSFLLFFIFTCFLFKKNLRSIAVKVDFLFLLLYVQVIVNFIGALGPELGFDALWYHLTLPKLYLLTHSIYHIPGGLLYYSDMPKLGEMLYIPALFLGGEIGAKLIHFSFGLLTTIMLYKLSRHFLNEKYSILAMLTFYSCLVVGWESISAYIDLIRTFYELFAFMCFIVWIKSKKKKWLLSSALFVGLELCTKILAFQSLLIYLFLFFYIFRRKVSVSDMLLFFTITVITVSPWFFFSFINTGSFIYPFFSDRYPIFLGGALSLTSIVQEFWKLFVHSADPISPLYIIIFPLLLFVFKAFTKVEKILIIYSVLSLLFWYFTPRTGGGRFILPYLPVLSILCVVSILKIKDRFIHNIITVVIVFLAFVSVGYRSIANAKYIPVIIGKETKSHFLTNHLNFDFGDFYDTDSYFKTHITTNDKVLLFGFHNLYYVDFPFVDSSWVKKGDKFNYIAVQKGIPPGQFSDWEKIYENKVTRVKLYTKGRIMWEY